VYFDKAKSVEFIIIWINLCKRCEAPGTGSFLSRVPVLVINVTSESVGVRGSDYYISSTQHRDIVTLQCNDVVEQVTRITIHSLTSTGTT